MLTELAIDPTPKNPQIDFNQLTGELIISGRSIPENAAKVYEPLFSWISEYILEPNLKTNLRLNLEYFNTASSIWLKKIIKLLLKINNPESVLIIHLYLSFEDFDEIEDFNDIRDAFVPISDIDNIQISSIGIKLHALDENNIEVKEKLIFFDIR